MEGGINQVGLSVGTLWHYNAEFMKKKKGVPQCSGISTKPHFATFLISDFWLNSC